MVDKPDEASQVDVQLFFSWTSNNNGLSPKQRRIREAVTLTYTPPHLVGIFNDASAAPFPFLQRPSSTISSVPSLPATRPHCLNQMYVGQPNRRPTARFDADSILVPNGRSLRDRHPRPDGPRSPDVMILSHDLHSCSMPALTITTLTKPVWQQNRKLRHAGDCCERSANRYAT